MVHKRRKYLGYKIEKKRIIKSTYNPRGVMWVATKLGEIPETQRTSKALKFSLRLSKNKMKKVV